MTKNGCFILELKEVKIDLNSTKPNPRARFKLEVERCKCQKYPYKELCVKYRAILSSKINIKSEEINVSVDKFGHFSFLIPKLTRGLEVIVSGVDKCCCCSSIKNYYPNNCRPDFTSSLLTTRMTIKECSQMAIDTSGLDHQPVQPGENRIFGHQLGPCRASRAIAIVHIAMFDAIISIIGGYKSYLNLPKAPSTASIDAAICKASHDTLIALFPSHAPRLETLSQNLLNQIPNGLSKQQGIDAGAFAAATILALRSNDGSNHKEPVVGIDYIPSTLPGEWTKDPISNIPVALGALWSQVKPFIIPNADSYRCPTPPALNSEEYNMAYNEAKVLGGDGINTPTVRSEEQTFIGNYWAYDGTPSLCAPPRLYNQIVMQIGSDQGLDTIELCRLLALVNVAMADTAIACWDSKYFYKFWRPIVAIRSANTDGNDKTIEDPNWKPLGAPASNLSNGVNFTPPFPAYPSGHACFLACVCQVLINTFGTDDLKFTFVSDEYNGKTLDNNGNVRPYKPRTFDTLTQAEDENGDSRIYLGIHFKFDKTNALPLGNSVGNDIYNNLYQPI